MCRTRQQEASMKQFLVWSLILFAMVSLQSFSLQTPGGALQRELGPLVERGITNRLIDPETIEFKETWSGKTWRRSLREPSEATIRGWAALRGIPILEIDPNTIDTSQYTGWYNYWTTVPLGNSFGNPLIIGDLNHNGQADVYGAYKDTLSLDDYQARLYEIDPLGNVFLRYRYVPRPGISRLIADEDRDSLQEVSWQLSGLVAGYEQHSQDSLPVHRTFAHDMYYHNSSSGQTGIYIGRLDEDSLTDFLYQGSEPDPNDTNIAVAKTFVAEYDPVMQNFVRVWSSDGLGAAGFSVGDFDGDGRMEFATTRASGKVFMVENVGNNQYALAWQDSTAFVNFYYHGSGDVDNDCKIEFFTGATMSNGNWVLMYEADSNNTYSAKCLFHLVSGGVFADPIYTTVDIDGDGELELAMMVGSDLFVFKSQVDNEYYLWYYRRENRMEAIAFYDFDHNGRMDFVASKRGSTQGNVWFYADIYLATPLVEVHEQGSIEPDQTALYPNYPNPFNPTTTIRFSLPSRQHVIIAIYDLLGRRVATLIDETVQTGTHSVEWKPSFESSGIYFCRLQTSGNLLSTKLLLLK
jgi:hypothetical protein